MLDKLFKKSSDFTIKEIDHATRVVIVEDKELGLEVKLTWGNKDLKSAEIIGTYELCFHYQDGSDRIVKILN
jgi:hypothetical protein